MRVVNFVVIFFLAYCNTCFSQDSAKVLFSYTQKNTDGKNIEFIITAKPSRADIKLFPLKKSDADAVYSTVTFDTSVLKVLQDSIHQVGKLITIPDESLGGNVSVIADSVQWIQKLNVQPGDSALLKGTVAYMFHQAGEYGFAEEGFRFIAKHTDASNAVNANGINTTNNKDAANKSLLWIFIAGFAGGLIALVTPCVYSMIPITVSFFIKRSKTKAEGKRNAMLYSTSIVLIFTLLGLLITLIFGADALNKLATNWIANLVFFIIFVIFGFSFLGAFEIELPASWGNVTDSNAGTKSLGGIFFMALTLVIVSFSCTGPIIGNLLVLAAKGSRMGPLMGMLGFSLGLALPFAFFAFFPSRLNMLGKSGGWLNAVKVTLGFLELALALKFLSNADLTQNWRLLDREVFLVLWIVIFVLLGIYLLGAIRFKHDSELPKNDFGLPHLTVTRLFFALTSFAFAVYMIPGLWGAPLKGLSAFVPPMGTQDFNADDLPKGYNLNNAANYNGGDNKNGGLPEPVKYLEVMKKNEPDVVVNNGLITYFDYNEALGVARKLKKPLMLDFTGVNCINCRKMEGEVWSNPEVMKRLKNDFVIASLFVDVHKGVDLPVAEQYFSKDLGKHIETLGERNTDLQISKFGSNSQPFYFFLDGEEKRLAPDGYGYDPSVSKFIAHLDNVVAQYKKGQQ